MKKHVVAVVALLLCCHVFCGSADAAGEWTRIKDSDGIKCYERSVPGTDLKEYIGVTTLDARMEVIGEVLRDIERFPEWISDCASAKIEKKYDRNTFVLYLILEPLLIQPRDIVLKNETVYDYENGNARVSFFCTNEVNIPVNKKRTRVKVMDGLYKMEYLGRNKTKFIYRLKVDPAGDIPKSIAYSVMKYYPYQTLKKLKKLVAESKYAAAAKGSEEEREINVRSVDENTVKKIFTSNMIRVVRDKALLTEIIASDSESIKNIAASGGAYESVHKAARDTYFKYIDKKVADKKTVERLRGNAKMIAELTDLVTTNCEANYETIDSIVARYNR